MHTGFRQFTQHSLLDSAPGDGEIIMDPRDIDLDVPTERDDLNCPPDFEVLGVPAKPIEDDDISVTGKDSKLAWLVCFSAFLIQVLIVGVLHVFGVFFVAFIEEFHVSRAEAAWVASVAYGLTMFLGPIASTLIIKCGNRIVAVLGCLICGVSLVVTSFMPNIPSMYGSFGFLYGVGTCLAYTPTMTIAGDYFDKYLTIATGIMVAGSSTGTLILSPIAQTMVTNIGWRNSLRVFAGLTVLGAIAGAMFKPLKAATPQHCPEKAVKKSMARPLMQELQLWKDKVFVLWILGITFAMFGYYVPYVHLVSHAQDLGIPPEKASLLLMVLGGCTATGRVMFGKIVDYGFLNRLHMHQLSMVVTGTACMMLPLITEFYGLVLYVILVGLVDGCFVVLQPVLTSSLFGSDHKVAAWGFLICVSSITFTLGPPVAGWLYDYYGSYNVAFHVAGVPIILGAVTLLFIPWAQRTAISTNVMEAARNVYDTNLYQETIETAENRNEPLDDIPLNLYAITAGETSSTEPMLKRSGSELKVAGEDAKPYLVVDITEAVRKTVEEALESFHAKPTDIEAIKDGPLSQLGTPVFKIGSLQDRGRSQRATPSSVQQPYHIKLSMSPMVVDNNVGASAPRVIYPGTSLRGARMYTPSSSVAASFKARGAGVAGSVAGSKSPTTSMMANTHSSINDLRRRMMHTGDLSPGSAPKVVVPMRRRTSDFMMAGSMSRRQRYLSDCETQTEIKGLSHENLALTPGTSVGRPFDILAPLVQLDEPDQTTEKTPLATPLRSPASQPFTSYDKQHEQKRHESKEAEDSFVHVDLPSTSGHRAGSSTEVTPANTPRKLGETEPMFQMSDIDLSEQTDSHQHHHQQQQKK